MCIRDRSYSKDDDTSYLQLLCGYADEKKLAETKELQFESITEARAQVKELTDKMGYRASLVKRILRHLIVLI